MRPLPSIKNILFKSSKRNFTMSHTHGFPKYDFMAVDPQSITVQAMRIKCSKIFFPLQALSKRSPYQLEYRLLNRPVNGMIKLAKAWQTVSHL